MEEVGKRFVQTLRFERDAFVWMDFNDRATGDALIVLLIGRTLLFLGLVGFNRIADLVNFRSIEGFVLFLVQGLIFWLLYSGIAWAILKYLLKKTTSYALLLRFIGFAYPAVLLMIALVALLPGTGLLAASIAVLLGSAWFLIIVARGIEYAADLPFPIGLAVGVGAYLGYLVVSAILSGLPI